MDKVKQDYYDAYFAMFKSTGWKQFLAELVASKDDIKNMVINAKDLREMGLLQGQLLEADKILAMEPLLRNAYENELEDSDDVV